MVTFRKTQKFGPFRFTITPRGVSTSFGGPGARMSINSRGEVHRTVGIPGTGIYDRKKISGKPAAKKKTAEPERSLEEIAWDLILSLSADDLIRLTEAYRADPEDGLAFLGRSLTAAGMPVEQVDRLRPSARKVLDELSD